MVVMESACVLPSHPAQSNSWYDSSSPSSSAVPSSSGGLMHGTASAAAAAAAAAGCVPVASQDATAAAAAVADELAGAYFKGQNYFSHMQGAYHGMSNGVCYYKAQICVCQSAQECSSHLIINEAILFYSSASDDGTRLLLPAAFHVGHCVRSRRGRQR